MAELAYACGLGPHPEKVAGSNPARDTMRKIVLIFGLSLFLFFLIPSQTLAAGPVWKCNWHLVPCGTADTPPCEFCHIFVLLSNILNFILFCITPLVAALMIIIAGVWFLATGGSPEFYSQAKSVLTAAVIGLVIVLAAWVFLNEFLVALDIAEWTGLKTWWEITGCPASP